MNLLQRGGVMVVGGLLGRDLLEELRADARERFEKAKRFVTPGGAREERGGEPARAYWATEAGPIQYRVFTSPSMIDALSDLCGFRVGASGAGSYSYYYEEGDHLGVHRDIVRCEVATITCVEDDGPDLRGGLRAYPDYVGRQLAAIHQEHPRGIDILTRPGDTIVIAGGIVPHEVTPAVRGQHRAVALSCYAVPAFPG